jgi:malonyl-CoA O-methyltransferase
MLRHVTSSADFNAQKESIIPTQSGYDRWSEFYDVDENPLVLLEDLHFPKLLGPVKGLEVADIGCGTGRHALRLVELGGRVTAVDFSQGMLERAKEKAAGRPIRFIQHDLAHPLPLPDAAFDRVICCLVLDHIADLESFFRELKRICKPDGFIAISGMHPAMTLKGVQARFTDPSSGNKVLLAGAEHCFSDYIMAVVRAGLRIEHLSEHCPDAALSARCERAKKYEGWPTLMLMKLRWE